MSESINDQETLIKDTSDVGVINQRYFNDTSKKIFIYHFSLCVWVRTRLCVVVTMAEVICNCSRFKTAPNSFP